MRRVKLSLNYRGLDHSGKKVFANSILTKLTGNTNYPNPNPELPVLQTAINNLDAAINAPVPNEIAIKAKEVFLEKVLYALKGYVELMCDDDEEKALSSGFSLKKSAGVKPKVFAVKQGKLSGSVDLVCPFRPKGAYVWEYCADPINENNWKLFKVTNSTSAKLSGLIPGNKYWFRAKAIVKDVDEEYGDPHMLHVV